MSREAIYEQVQMLAKEQDLFAASEYVTSLGEDAAATEAFHFLIVDVYYKAKSTDQVLHFGHAGMQYCLTRAAAVQKDDAKRAAELRYSAKQMATNVASFTWPAWEEQGIAISPSQLAEGLTFARASVRIANDLKLEAKKLGCTAWFLGAQLLANDKHDEAAKVFSENVERYAAMGDQPEQLAMNEGYLALAKSLAGDAAASSAFDQAVARLKAMDGEDGPFFATQLVDVRKFFIERSKR